MRQNAILMDLRYALFEKATGGAEREVLGKIYKDAEKWKEDSMAVIQKARPMLGWLCNLRLNVTSTLLSLSPSLSTVVASYTIHESTSLRVHYQAATSHRPDAPARAFVERLLATSRL